MDFEFLWMEFMHETAPLAVAAEATLLAIERNVQAGEPDDALWRELLGLLHTIKGNAGMVRCTAVQSLAHAMEDRARAARAAPPAQRGRSVSALLAAVDALKVGIRQPDDEATARSADALRSGTDGANSRESPPSVERVSEVRVRSERLDRLLELVGELTTHHGRLRATIRGLCERLSSADVEAAATMDLVDQLGAVVRELRESITTARLMPLGAAVVRFERLVRDLCASTGKRATLKVTGAATVVDKTIVDAVGEPLLHMLRNAVDHGIEPPDERVSQGKPSEGRIDLDIGQKGGELVFTVRDDGRGIDRARLVERASAFGIDAGGWPDEKVLDLVFYPSLSTSERVTDLSGRGVGLDVAKRAIDRIGGTVLARSERGRGTEFRFRVPLTLTIQRSLVVRRCEEVFAMPVSSVLASARISAGESPVAREFMRWRGALVALYDLGTWLSVPGADHAPASFCVIVEDVGTPCGLLVDEVLGQQEIVLKELDVGVGPRAGLAGATVLGDGRVAMVVDPRAIAASRRLQPRAVVAGAAPGGRL
jgi:two-component system chemotaxis sensor kinase CheA